MKLATKKTMLATCLEGIITNINASISVGTAAAELADSLTSPEILLLHGITKEALLKDNITLSELSYLVKSFTMGETYYRVHELDKAHIRLTVYRRNLLRHPVVQVAWKQYIRGKFISTNAYIEAIDEFLRNLALAAESELSQL